MLHRSTKTSGMTVIDSWKKKRNPMSTTHTTGDNLSALSAAYTADAKLREEEYHTWLNTATWSSHSHTYTYLHLHTHHTHSKTYAYLRAKHTSSQSQSCLHLRMWLCASRCRCLADADGSMCVNVMCAWVCHLSVCHLSSDVTFTQIFSSRPASNTANTITLG